MYGRAIGYKFASVAMSAYAGTGTWVGTPWLHDLKAVIYSLQLLK